MADLKTKYLGLTLRNPVIVGSSSLTDNVETLAELESYGAGAVVLKSLFEEEVTYEMEINLRQMNSPSHATYPEIVDLYDLDTVEDTLSKYLALIHDAKKKLKIPVIASVNCVSGKEWTSFAARIEEAGADALELNAFILPSNFNNSSQMNEDVYFEIINNVKNVVNIPIALKISYYFSNLGSMIQRLSQSGVSGMVLFNRFFSPDFDIDNFRVIPANIYSTPSDLTISLRWIALMSARVQCDLAASTGVHNGTAVIKQLLAGANAVQVVSTLYKNGNEYLRTILEDVEHWMNKKHYESIDDFRGKMSQAKSLNAAAYERSQFMKHFSQKF